MCLRKIKFMLSRRCELMIQGEKLAFKIRVGRIWNETIKLFHELAIFTQTLESVESNLTLHVENWLQVKKM